MPATHSSSPLYTPFGIRPADEKLPGLVAGNFNFLEAPDATTSDVALAHFLYHSLVRGARAAIVAFDNPHLRLSQFAGYGFDFSRAVEEDNLAYVYYRPTLSRALGLGADYGSLVSELRRLIGPVERIGFLNPEVMFNLESDSVATDSISRFVASTSKLGATALGLSVPDGTEGQVRLKAIGARLFAGAFTLRHVSEGRGYVLESLKSAQSKKAVNLVLQEGKGYVAEPGFGAQIA